MNLFVFVTLTVISLALVTLMLKTAKRRYVTALFGFLAIMLMQIAGAEALFDQILSAELIYINSVAVLFVIISIYLDNDEKKICLFQRRAVISVPYILGIGAIVLRVFGM